MSGNQRGLRVALSIVGGLVWVAAGAVAAEVSGFVADGECSPCHAAVARSFTEVAMAQAIARPRPDNVDGPLGEVYVHEPSGQRFVLFWRAGRLIFRRFLRGDDGEMFGELEIPVDWVLGSGRHARTYLHRTASGELYQLPLAWYAESGSWAMAPGFDRPDHDGVTRRVRRECIACHAALPAIAPGGDARWAPQRFPDDLGEGIGCQRCHGPGQEHVKRAWADGTARQEIRAAIVNPARLPRERRDDVCAQCHLQPSVLLPGIARPDQGDFAFRPGDRLDERRILVEVEEEGRPAGERFEINHHAYRLRQSRCFLASGGAISCVDCHDPHRRPAREELASRVRAVCVACHPQPAVSAEAPASVHRDASADCAGCHLSKRRAQDVVHAVMTDHRIARRPLGSVARAPLAEREPALTGVTLYAPPEGRGAAAEDLDRTLAVVRLAGGASPAAASHLAALFAAAPPSAPELWLDLAWGQLGARRYAAARSALERALAAAPAEPQAREWLALAKAGEGDGRAAIADLRALLADDPDRPEATFNLGRLLLARGDAAAAVPPLERALALRPNLAAAAFRLGEARRALGEGAAVRAAFAQAFALDPRHTEAALAWAEAELAGGDRPAALRVLRFAARHATHPERARARLDELESEPRKATQRQTNP